MRHLKSVIKDSHLHLKGSSEKVSFSTCYAPFDINKPFELKVESFVKSLTGKKKFGIIVDFEDEYNYVLFTIEDDLVVVERFVKNEVVARSARDLKLKAKKKVGIDFRLEYTLSKLTLFVNDMNAIEYQRRLPNGEYMLGTSGIGFFAGKNTEVDFDNLQITQ